LKKYIEVSARAHGSLSVDDNDLLSLPIPLPAGTSSLAEQQKIAECLSTLGELIGAEYQKLYALKAHKRGLMQQLFPRAGESLPGRRFPEFQNAPEWSYGELCNYLETVIDYRGKAPPKSNSGIPLITAKNVRFGWLDMSNDEYIEDAQYDTWMSKGIPEAEDILFTTEAPLGNVAPFPSKGRFALGQRILTLRANKGKCLPGFLFQFLLSPVMQKAIEFRSTGSTAKGIKASVFVSIGFCVPGIEEQRRIASCLSSLDELIAAQSDKLEALQTHKKGLMQQLFP
jgi:type I restriction enzyme S subunit